MYWFSTTISDKSPLILLGNTVTRSASCSRYCGASIRMLHRGSLRLASSNPAATNARAIAAIFRLSLFIGHFLLHDTGHLFGLGGSGWRVVEWLTRWLHQHPPAHFEMQRG